MLTPHNNAKLDQIADTVIMPGDPLRAKYIADNYLTDVVCYNEVRGILGYTGLYNGFKISVQASGMGCPSMGIYSKELFDIYNVKNIIRIGTTGSINEDINCKDIIVATSVTTDSNYPKYYLKSDNLILNPSQNLVDISKSVASNLNISPVYGKIQTSDIFYAFDEDLKNLAKSGILAVEMETAALYTNAIVSKKQALSILTVSDKPLEKIGLSALERQEGFDEMLKYSLEIAKNI